MLKVLARDTVTYRAFASSSAGTFRNPANRRMFVAIEADSDIAAIAGGEDASSRPPCRRSPSSR
jgi:hypothetical protein